MKKRIFGAVALAGIAALTLASCGHNDQTTSGDKPTTTTTTGTPKTTTGTNTTPTGTNTTTTNPTPTSTVEIKDGVYEDKTLDLSSAIDSTRFGGEKEIVFYHTMGDNLTAVLQVAIDEFEAKYPGWKINHSQIGGYDDVLQKCISSLAAGAQPDLAYCYADHVAQYIRSGKVVDMSDYVHATGTIDGNKIGYTDAELADFVPGYFAEGYATNYGLYDKIGYNDTDMLTFPFVKSTEVLYYNKDALTAAGITKAPETWDELWADCEILVDVFDQCTPLGYDSEANWVITMAAQNGWGYTSAAEPHFLFKNEGLTNWLDQLYQYHGEYYFTTQKEYGGYTSGLFTMGPEAGGTVFSIGSSGGAKHQETNDFKWGVAPIPGSVQENGSVNKSVISQGPSLVMFQSSKSNATERQLMTWEFVKCLEGAKFQAQFSMASGYNPTRKSTFQIEEYEDFLSEKTNIVAVTAGVAAQMTNDFFTSPAFSGSSTARGQMESVLLYVISGQKSGAQALQDALTACGGN